VCPAMSMGTKTRKPHAALNPLPAARLSKSSMGNLGCGAAAAPGQQLTVTV